ncbi:hypothetical protein ACTFIR_007567, partial [Dictyostelium discoideum]
YSYQLRSRIHQRCLMKLKLNVRLAIIHLTQVVITLQETVIKVNPIVGVMADLTTSMYHQVMLLQVEKILSLQTGPATVFRRTKI